MGLSAKKHHCEQLFQGLGYHNLNGYYCPEWMFSAAVVAVVKVFWLQSLQEWTNPPLFCTLHKSLFLNKTSWFKHLPKRLYHNPLQVPPVVNYPHSCNCVYKSYLIWQDRFPITPCWLASCSCNSLLIESLWGVPSFCLESMAGNNYPSHPVYTVLMY